MSVCLRRYSTTSSIFLLLKHTMVATVRTYYVGNSVYSLHASPYLCVAMLRLGRERDYSLYTTGAPYLCVAMLRLGRERLFTVYHWSTLPLRCNATVGARERLFTVYHWSSLLCPMACTWWWDRTRWTGGPQCSESTAGYRWSVYLTNKLRCANPMC